MLKLILGRAFILSLSIALGACDAREPDTEGKDGRYGVQLKESATEQDVGLPVYPGAIPYVPPRNSSAGANVGISTPLFGLKVAAMSMQTKDSPQKVGQFYKAALAQFGEVVECTAANAKKHSLCEDAESEDAIVYRVGTKEDFRMVVIKNQNAGTQFGLVRIDVR